MILFYGGFMSNWYESPFILPIQMEHKKKPFLFEFQNAEQYFMWQKAMTFGDSDAARRILQADHPSHQKAIGRTVKGFDKKEWDSKSYGAMTRACTAKYSQNPKLALKLLDTYGKMLVEASPTDTIWGIGLAEDDPDARDPGMWKGQNKLGEVLMNVRAQLYHNANAFIGGPL